MKLIFLREETTLCKRQDSPYKGLDLRSVYFVDADTNNTYKYLQAENINEHLSLWWYLESTDSYQEIKWWMPADDLGNAMMDLMIEQATPFKK